jgi:aminoglycoside 6'-N-acetyltransferase
MTRDAAFTTIETERLRLRRFRDADVDPFQAYRADPAVARFQSWHDHTREQAERFVTEIAGADPGVPGEPFQFAVARLDDDVLVGDCMLAVAAGDPPTAEIGYTIGPGHQGLGFATEAVRAVVTYAFERQGVVAVRAVTDARNLASIRVAERLGLRRVATVHTTFKGEPCDEHTYEVVRDAWAGTG